jgi:hypothetical protein
MIQSSSFAGRRWRGANFASTTGARLSAISRTSRFVRSASTPGTAAPRARKPTGLRVGTRKRVAKSQLNYVHEIFWKQVAHADDDDDAVPDLE